MKARHIVCQVYFYTLAFALLTMGAIALAGHWQGWANHAVVLLPGSAVALMMAGLLLLSVIYRWHRWRMLPIGLLCAIALVSLTMSAWPDNAMQYWLSSSGFVPIRSALAIMLGLLAVAVLGNMWNRIGEWLSRTVGTIMIVVAAVSQFSYVWSIPERVRLGSDIESVTIIDLFVVLLGIAAWLLPRLKLHEERLDYRSVLVGLVGVVLTCIGGYLLSLPARDVLLQPGEQALANQSFSIDHHRFEQLAPIQYISAHLNHRHAHASSDLPALIVLIGLCFSFFLLLSQRLARLARERAAHLSRVNEQLSASLEQQTSLEALNRRIMHFSMDVLCSFDEEGRFIQVSPACETVFGYRPDEMIGKPFIEFVVPEDRERTLQTVSEDMHIGGRERPHFRNRYLHKEGHTIHVLWSAVWSTEERTIFAVAHDITRLIQHEAVTEGQRDILEMISTNQSLPMILEAICAMTEAQDPGALCAILLLDKKQHRFVQGAAPSLSHDYLHALLAQDSTLGMGACEAAIARRTPVFSNDIANDPLWETHRELALSHGLRACCSKPLIAYNDEILGILSVYYRQVTEPCDEQQWLIDTYGQLAALAIERDQDRCSLQEREQHYRSLFAFNPSPVFSFDLEGRLLSINQAGCELSGYQEEDIIGSNFAAHVLPEDLPRVSELFQAVIEGVPQRYEVKVLSRHGDIQELDAVNLPIIVNEQIVGVFGIGKDITEQKAAERQLDTTLQELERSNRELQDFASVASHDLQEPLRKIQAFSERLQMKATDLDEDARDYLNRMSSAANRMQALIRDLLTYSRVSTHAQPFAPVDLNLILTEVLQDMEASLEESGAQLDHEPLPPLWGDATQMRQLLQNLLSNAIKFHREGCPPYVRIYAEQSSQDVWTLCVSDEGIGFDEKYLDRIFNPFQRLHSKQAYTGTGIGLAIVKKIVERHGARITASSGVGQGTTFRITFNALSEE